jgi:hypothetical protein
MASLLDARAASARHNVAINSHGAWHDSDPLDLPFSQHMTSAFHNGGSSKIAIFRHGNEASHEDRNQNDDHFRHNRDVHVQQRAAPNERSLARPRIHPSTELHDHQLQMHELEWVHV